MSENFELVVAHLLPACPVATQIFSKRNAAHISSVGRDLKVGTGPHTGVEICYFKPPEFAKLSQEEVIEILELRPPLVDMG